MRAVVTAGGTSEPIDDVRVITNLSTGRLGAAIASALVDQGIEVTLLASAALASHPEWIDSRVTVVPFRRFADLDDALEEAIQVPPEFLFMAAAVSDYSPAPTTGKIRSTGEELTLRLRRNPKLLTSLRERCGPNTTLVGFKLLSGVSPSELIEVGRRQVITNDLDLCLANDLAELSGDRHPAWIVAREGRARRVDGSKADVARQLVRFAVQRGLGSVSVAGLEDLLGPDDTLVERGHGLEPLFALHPTVRAVLQVSSALVIPSARGTFPLHQGGVEQMTAALAREAWAGRWTGGGFSVRTGDHDALVAITESGLWGLHERWTRTVAAWTKTVDGLGLDPSTVEPRPVWFGSRLIGVHCETPSGTAVWLRPEARGRGHGDRLYVQLSARGLSAFDHPALSLADWFGARGWVPGVPGSMVPPSKRDGLTPAASVCLLDPHRRRVLLGLRRTEPWLGYWAFPGGSRSGEETALQTALRELEEETGIELPGGEPLLETHLVVGGARGFYLVNLVLGVLHAPVPQLTDELEGRWVDLGEALELSPMAAGTRRILRRLVDSAPA